VIAMEYDPEIDARIWAQSDDDDDYKPLCVDEILAEPFVRSRLRCSLQGAKRLVRRTIEVAYVEVLRVNNCWLAGTFR
jgi:hypothetical protein